MYIQRGGYIMNIDDEDISDKSQMITLLLALIFGRLGLHRFYVQKYVTGVIYLLIGGTSIVLDILGWGYAFMVQVVYLIFIVLDVYALYSDSFTDGKGRIVGGSKTLVYETLAQREQILFDRKVNKVLCILLGVVFYIGYLLVNHFVF